MAGTTDAEVAQLAKMVVSLAVQVASLTPCSSNSNTPLTVPVPPAPPIVVAAMAASAVPTATLASPAQPTAITSTTVAEHGDNIVGEPGGSSSHRRWYVVIVGLQVGVFHGWTNAAPLVLGVTGSIYNCEPTHEIAITAFNTAAAIRQVQLVD
ncbi:hypothetical protein BDN71DRAFT_1512423 [Pleurotus eryngii]|uniref:Ribonuclease H1 N-terminal domain-containing protein n=1 Tax=Pleurotus eryngii TaxID=5323 RepID=A0A9P5ZKV0_PLEER|nr:hypothetical protein BDN71DRAFT_1512423 [Pleurotus eryngii]